MEGCNLCEESARKLYWLDDEDIIINGLWHLSNKILCADNTGGEYGDSQMHIKYCPICGRKL